MSDVEKIEMKLTHLAEKKYDQIGEKRPKRRYAFSVIVFGAMCLLISAIFLSEYGLPATQKSTETEWKSLSGVISISSVGRGQAISLLDANSKILASCNILDCGYPGALNDSGKEAVFRMSGKLVQEISMGGITMLSVDRQNQARQRKQLFAVAIGLVGLVCVGLGLIRIGRK